jgi:hypothetical protein
MSKGSGLMMHTTRRSYELLLLGLCLVGCSASQRVNIGDTAVLGAQLSDYAGNWEGYAEAYTWADGTDAVRLKLDAQGSGVLEVGNLPNFAAVDPNGGPPGNEWWESTEIMALGQAPPHLLPGFSYPVYDAMVETQRIRLNAQGADIFESWCSSFTPMLLVGVSPLTYSCQAARWVSIETGRGGPGDLCQLWEDIQMQIPIGTPFDCANECDGWCACTETSCQAMDSTKNVQLDGALQPDGEELVGTLVNSTDRITVHLMRK